MNKFKDEVMESILDSATGLFEAGLISENEMNRYNDACLNPIGENCSGGSGIDSDNIHAPNFKHKSLWTGDNLEIMRKLNSNCVDLIYLDPPYRRGANFVKRDNNLVVKNDFKDYWPLDDINLENIELLKRNFSRLHTVILTAPTNSDKAYLSAMAIRLLEMKRILKFTGSIYLHCDPNISHWMKVMMDTIFGKKNFRNEIVWNTSNATIAKKRFKKSHDVILYYSMSSDYVFNTQYQYTSKPKKPYKSRLFALKGKKRKQLLVYDRGKASKEIASGKYDDILYIKYTPGTPISDYWSDISSLNPRSKEYTVYPGQKPMSLLERIIKTSSDPGDLVFDPFCGTGTTLIAAHKLNRKWAGIDISPLSLEILNHRLKNELPVRTASVKLQMDTPERTDLGKINSQPLVQ